MRNDRVPDPASGYPKDLVSIARGPARAFLVAEGFSPEATSEILDGFLQWLEQQPLPHAEMGTDRELRLWLLHSLEDFLVRHDWKPPVTGGGPRPERAPESEAEPCPICGATLRVRGMCGACLLSASLPAPEAPPETDTVENYRLVELLGSGGESNVYRARQSDQDRDVALKILLTECAEEFDAIEQFRDTARLVAKLEHPNIVRIYDRAGLGLKRPYYTMQLVEGGSLADRRAKFSEQRRAARLMIKIARAVQYAHERGVLHQDLKPHNVLVGEDGEPYVTDFMAHPVAKPSLGPRGSYGYMPWEQAAGHGATIASDVYGLG
ncbi:MAG TPA: serine/threonine-protein kinase, partial [Polyangiaceae bacterium]